MKRIALGLALVVPSLLGLHGCAGLPTAGTSADEIDSARVASIERVAQQSGVRVLWVRMPQKKAATGS